MEICFALKHQMIARLDCNIIASNSKNYLRAKFELQTEDWSAPITAIFNDYSVLLDENNECLVPWEVLSQPGRVNVSAFCGDLHTTITTSFVVHPSGYVDGQTPNYPTPSVYQQLISMVQNAITTANSAADTAKAVSDAAESGAFDGKQGDPGPQGPKGADGTVSFEELTDEQRESLKGEDAPQIDDSQASSDHPWSGAKILEFTNLTYVAIANNAGGHNAVYRGKYLGSAVTEKQWAAIRAGTFEDMFIGDYWTINDVVWRIAAFDYYYKTGDTECKDHHLTIVPDTNLMGHVMNTEETTDGAYVGSSMYIHGLQQAKKIIDASFPEEHILKHRQFLKNAVTNGFETGGSWYDSTLNLMTEQNVYGCKIWNNATGGTNLPQITQ